MKNTTKNTKTILFASLIAAMILPFSMVDYADADKNNTTSMKAIHEKIKNANGAEKKQLKSEYIAKNKQHNEKSYKKPARDFVAEWKSLDLVQMNIAEQRHVANEDLKNLTNTDKKMAKQLEINQKDNRINAILNQIQALQQESIEFMTLDFDTQLKFDQIVSDLYTIYGTENSENAFVMAGINYEQKKVTVELTTANDENVSNELSSVALAEKIRDSIGDENVIITIDSFTQVTCTDYLAECTPRVGGVAIYRSDDPTRLAGSIGYKATYNGDVGYVTAGHVVDFENTGNRAMNQITSQISNGFGYPYMNNVSDDYSFQSTSVDMSDDIYFNSSTKVDVESYATGSSEHPGQYVYKMGAGNGISWGYVDRSYGSDTYATTASTVQGDSGGPIFQIYDYENGQYIGKLLGHTIRADAIVNGNAVYKSTDAMFRIGIIPSTD